MYSLRSLYIWIATPGCSIKMIHLMKNLLSLPYSIINSYHIMRLKVHLNIYILFTHCCSYLSHNVILFKSTQSKALSEHLVLSIYVLKWHWLNDWSSGLMLDLRWPTGGVQFKMTWPSTTPKRSSNRRVRGQLLHFLSQTVT